MERTLKELLGLVKNIPAEYFEETYEKLAEIKEKAESDAAKEAGDVVCVKCSSKAIVRNGKRHGKQAYRCKDCGKTFVDTTASGIWHSHSGETVWKAVIDDTVNGVSIDKTAENLDLTHNKVWEMRHKILVCVEQAVLAEPVDLEGVCEADETYIIESVKGRKIPENYHRKSRKHGAKASKPGISEEYICVQTSVTGEGKCIAHAVNRATPSKAEIVEVFSERIIDDTVILCDGNANYDVLNEKCRVAHTERINKVNGFHSFIKERIRAARGVSTTYLNRYNALFESVFANQQSAVDLIFNLMTSRNNSFISVADIKFHNLLNV